MDFDSIVKSLAEAIEAELDLRESDEVEGMPAKTIRILDPKSRFDNLHPKQIAIVEVLLESGKTPEDISELLNYPIDEVRAVEKLIMQTA